MAGENVEKLISIDLSESYKKPTSKRAKYAIGLLRSLVARHSKSQAGLVRISNSVASMIVRVRTHPLKLIKVKMVSVDGQVKVMLPEETGKVEKVEKKTEAKKEKPEPKKEETEKHVGGERKAPGAEEKEKTESEKTEEKERKEMQKLKK